MSERFKSESNEIPSAEPKLFDLSKELYEGGRLIFRKLGNM